MGLNNLNSVNNLSNYAGLYSQQLQTPIIKKDNFVSDSIYKQPGNKPPDDNLGNNLDTFTLSSSNATQPLYNKSVNAEAPLLDNKQSLSPNNMLFGYYTTSNKNSNFISELVAQKEENNNETGNFLSNTVPSSKKGFNILKLYKPGEILNKIING